MNPRVCICCGEPMVQRNSHSRNPNICASCSSLLDGMEDSPRATQESSDLTVDAEHERQTEIGSESAEPVYRVT